MADKNEPCCCLQDKLCDLCPQHGTLPLKHVYKPLLLDLMHAAKHEAKK